MRLLRWALTGSLLFSSLLAVQIGDSREAVIAEKGEPVGKLEAGSTELLRYADVTIRLRSGRVTAVEKVVVQPVRSPSPPAPPREGAGPQPVELVFPHAFVGVPEFDTTAGRGSAGTAFLARRPNHAHVFILTVRHLLGPDGGFAELVAPENVPAFVRGIRLHTLFGAPSSYPVVGLVVPAEKDRDAPLYDLAIFRTEAATVRDAAVLATELPQLGEPIWIVARVRGGVPEGTLIHATTVVRSADESIVCEFPNPEILTNGASGAPALNARGEVVGIYRGHSNPGGRKFAFLIPSTVVLRTLEGL